MFHFFIVLIQLVAFWSVWEWYFVRLIASPEARWGLLALGTFLLYLVLHNQKTEKISNSLLLPALLTLLYAISYTTLPPLLRAAIAMMAIGSTLSILRLGKIGPLGIWGILLLALPIIPTLQFYLGYPLRLLIASVAAPLIRLSGFAVIQEGVYLNWYNSLILIDAPCSGIKMLWAGFYLTFTLAAFYGLNPVRTITVSLLAFLIILLGNLFRSVALFYVEIGIVELPTYAHTGIGLLMFVFVAVSIVWCVQKARIW
jgi:exosortase/archaeosortase family protein